MAGVRVVVLAQPFREHRGHDPVCERVGVLAVAEPGEAEPHEPGRVDPGRAAPVAADPQPVVVTEREAGLGGGHGRRRHGEPVAGGVEQVLLDEAAADLLGQIRQRQRGERGPGEYRLALGLRARQWLEQPGRVVVHPLDDRRGHRGSTERHQRQAVQDVGRHLAAHRAAGAGDPRQVIAEPAVAPHEQDEPEPVVGAPAPDRVKLRRRVEARLIGLDDPDQPVAVEVAVSAQPVVVTHDPGDG